MELYNNTRSESKAAKNNGDGFTKQLEFGYFVPYGIHLENPVTRKVAIQDLQDWSDNKGLFFSFDKLNRIRRRLAKDPIDYPIIDETWNQRDFKTLYKDEVFNRVEEIWFS